MVRPCPLSSCLDGGERTEDEELMSAGMGRVVTTWVTTLEKNASSLCCRDELACLNFTARIVEQEDTYGA